MNAAPQKIRIDKWLWFARFFKTRALAADVVTGGHVRINRQPVRKASQTIGPGDVITFPQGIHIRVIEIVAIAIRRGPAPEARTLYTDLSPPEPRRREDPPPAIAERDNGTGRPTKKERRATDRLRAVQD